MSRSLKTKLFLIGFSLVVLVLIPLLESNFYAPVSMIRWRTLDWDDFQGFVKPFTGWDAGITSNVYVEFDSAQGNYRAYAAMNNQKSWTKERSIDSEDLLNHEQYHFNLTEFYARKLNQIIGVKNLKQEDQIQDQLDSIRAQLDAWQYQYDNEADHGLIRKKQRKWEFKIDSLLSGFSADSGYVSDYYSSYRAFMPASVTFSKGINDGRSYAYRFYSLNNYGMFLAMSSFQYFEPQSMDLTGSLFTLYRNDSLELRSMQIDSSVYRFHAIAEVFDSVANETTVNRWIRTADYMFKLTAKYQGDSIAEYRSIAHSFVQSFRIIDNGPYWRNEMELTRDTILVQNTHTMPAGEQSGQSECWAYVRGAPYGFYGKPIFYNDGSILIPYSVTNHADSLVQDLMVAHHNVQYFHEPTDPSFLYLPGRAVVNDAFSIDIGYTTTQRAKNGCLIFFNQSININKN